MKRMRIWLGVLVVAGCWGTTTPSRPNDTAVVAGKPASYTGVFTITSSGFGPIDAKQVATLQNLRQLFAGYDVRPVNDPNLEYHIYSGTEQLAFIVLNDDMTVFNIHATSGKIAVSDRPWRVGAPFQGSSELTQCECWGENPTCFKTGEHVAVNFKRACDGLTTGDHRSLKALDGQIVQRVIWSPSAFGGDSSYHGGFGGEGYGGADDGTDPVGP